MKKLFEATEMYISRCHWQDMALLKFCLTAAGILIGLCVPKKYKKCVWFTALLVFLVTYIPLMLQFLRAYQDVGCSEMKAK